MFSQHLSMKKVRKVEPNSIAKHYGKVSQNIVVSIIILFFIFIYLIKNKTI